MVILGQSGMGKSTLGSYLVSSAERFKVFSGCEAGTLEAGTLEAVAAEGVPFNGMFDVPGDEVTVRVLDTPGLADPKEQDGTPAAKTSQ
jgi:predicted GTPase